MYLPIQNLTPASSSWWDSDNGELTLSHYLHATPSSYRSQFVQPRSIHNEAISMVQITEHGINYNSDDTVHISSLHNIQVKITLTMQDSKFVFPIRGWCSCLLTPRITIGCPLKSSCFGARDIWRMPTWHDSQSTSFPEASLRTTTRVYKFGCLWKQTSNS